MANTPGMLSDLQGAYDGMTQLMRQRGYSGLGISR
jgi:hypothetical protein